MRINYDFGDLEAFLALFETGSFAKGAERLNISQSAFSRRLQKLEAALGTTLFERTTRSVTPTLQGRSFADRATALLQDADEAVRALGQDAERARPVRIPVITVAAVPTATQSLLPKAIKLFRERGFDARIRISDVNANGVLEAIAAGNADFGIGFLGTQEPGLDFRPIDDDPFVLVMPAGDPLSETETIRWQDIDPCRFIAIWRGSGNRLLIDAALARARITLGWQFEVQHLSTALGLVEAGLGVTALPRSALPYSPRHGINSRPLGDPAVSRTIGLVRRTRIRLSSAAEEFYQILLTEPLPTLTNLDA